MNDKKCYVKIPSTNNGISCTTINDKIGCNSVTVLTLIFISQKIKFQSNFWSLPTVQILENPCVVLEETESSKKTNISCQVIK